MKFGKVNYWVAGGLAGAALAAAALATPPSGILEAPVFARASFEDPVDIKFRIDQGSQKILQKQNVQEMAVQKIVLSPGGQTGWHSHPGPVIVLVKTGALSFYDGEDPNCVARVYSAGAAFIDQGQGHVHYAANESASDDLELWAVYFDVPPGGAFRIDVAAPGNCAF